MGAEGRHACMQAQRIKQAHTHVHMHALCAGGQPPVYRSVRHDAGTMDICMFASKGEARMDGEVGRI